LLDLQNAHQMHVFATLGFDAIGGIVRKLGAAFFSRSNRAGKAGGVS
jgi:hypothetical protein